VTSIMTSCERSLETERQGLLKLEVLKQATPWG